MALTEVEIERRALAIYERLSERPGNDRLRDRLLRREQPAVTARVAALERSGRPTEAWLATGVIGRGGARVPPPERIGPFRLGALVGEGGMGQVWRAVRDDGLYDQNVAVKLIHAHLAPLGGGRFAEERRILARLEHPNIARLIDGGVTDSGLPYLVMEYIEGAPIDEASAGRPLRERVKLFLKAAEAVQFAHGRLVVHADLKPSNILVSGPDWVKLLDFGIARLLDADEDETLHPMTRAYASPARLAGASPAISDDVYALGLILCDLVADSGDPDLLAIANKATAADERERYGSVFALIADLERWRGRLPVTAVPATVAYRSRRFVARHRLGVTATAAALLLLTGTSVAATWSYVEAERARADASARFDDVRGTARYLLFDLSDRLERLPGALPLRAEVAGQSQHYLDRLAASPNAPPEVRLESAAGLLALADRQGAAGRPNLGQPEAALANYDKGLAALTSLEGEAADPLKLRLLLSKAHLQGHVLSDLGAADRTLAEAGPIARRPAGEQLQALYHLRLSQLRLVQARYPESRREAQAAQALSRGSPAREPMLVHALATEVLGDAAHYGGDVPGSIQLYRQSVERWTDFLRRWPDDPVAARRLPRARYSLGASLLETDQSQGTVDLLAQATSEAQAVARAEPHDAEVARLHRIATGTYAQALAARGETSQAVTILSEVIGQRRESAGAAPGDTRQVRELAVSIAMLAGIELQAGRVAAACRRDGEALAVFAQLQRADGQTPLDEGNMLRLIRDRRTKHCRGAGAHRG